MFRPGVWWTSKSSLPRHQPRQPSRKPKQQYDWTSKTYAQQKKLSTGFPEYIIYALGRLLINQQDHNKTLFFKDIVFKSIPEPTFTLESLDCGSAASSVKKEFSECVKNCGRFPELGWKKPSPEVAEYVLVVEDADVSLSKPIIRTLFYTIQGDTTSIKHEDIAYEQEVDGEKLLRVRSLSGKTINNSVCSSSQPPPAGGAHRHFYTLVALREPLDRTRLSPVATKKEVCEAIEGKMIGWGVWTGS